MSYTDLSSAIIWPMAKYISQNWVNAVDTNFAKKHVLARVAHLGLTFISFLPSAADTVIGIGAGIVTIISAGKKEIFDFSMQHLSSTRRLLSIPYGNLLKTINPEIRFTVQLWRSNGVLTPKIGCTGEGFVHDMLIEPLKFNLAWNCPDLIERHVVSRLTYVLLAMACCVTRAVDGVIAIPATALSLLTAGKFESLNNLAYRTLQIPGVISDLTYCMIKIAKPRTGTYRGFL